MLVREYARILKGKLGKDAVSIEMQATSFFMQKSLTVKTLSGLGLQPLFREEHKRMVCGSKK